MRILVIHPGEEVVTKYTKYWLSRYIDIVQEGNDVIDVRNGDVTPELIWNAIINENPDFVYTAGHGLPGLTTISTIRGIEDLFWIPTDYPEHKHDDSNIDILSGKWFYMLSCFCGSALVPEIGDIGGVGAGYSEEFVFVIDPDRYGVEDDMYATSFGDCANQFAISVAEGKDLQTCLDETYSRFTSEVQAWGEWLYENPDAPSHQKVRARLCANYLASDGEVLTGTQTQPKIANIGMLIVVLLLIFGIIWGKARKEQLEEGKIF